jgi:hypothetical protein
LIIKNSNVAIDMLVLGPWPKLRSSTQRTWHAVSKTAMPPAAVESIGIMPALCEQLFVARSKLRQMSFVLIIRIK